jgi:anti-sigma factor RsiW
MGGWPFTSDERGDMMDKWTDRLSEYIDGELTRADRDALEAHLMTCAECGRALQQLRAVIVRAGQVIDREPQHDLWMGIATRIRTVEVETERSLATSPGKRRISFSIPQLAAASIALMVMSAGTVYMMLDLRDRSPVVQAPAVQPATAAQVSVRAVTHKYDAAVLELQTALANNRDQLDPATVRVLEQNLAIIDRAITDARAALGQEPANLYLSKYLDAAMQRKVQLLRRATGAMRAQT